MAKQTIKYRTLNRSSLEQLATHAKDAAIRSAANGELARREQARAATQAKRARVAKAVKADSAKPVKPAKSTNTTPLAMLAVQRVNGSPAQQAAAGKELQQVRKVRGEQPAPKPAKLDFVPGDAARWEDALAAVTTGKAPKGTTIRALFLQFLAGYAKGYSRIYQDDLTRGVGEFVGWLEGKKITKLSQIDTGVLLAYRKRAAFNPQGEPRRWPTVQKECSCALRFLRAQEDAVRADLGVLIVRDPAVEAKRAAKAAAKAAAAAAAPKAAPAPAPAPKAAPKRARKAA